MMTPSVTSSVGTAENPLRVAIIGSGPSGFYAADRLQKEKELAVEIDMFERLPTPYGLVRGGVAPDHPKIKSVEKVYEKIALQSNFRFYGHVNFGTDITHDELLRHYHAIIYAVGAQTDRELNIPGENLAGSYAATEFVGWYNGHPDYRHYEFDLTEESAAVIGVGNVAMDVARILASTVDELRVTDIADYALEALSQSRVKDIYVLGRRGPAQAAFTNPEIKELGELRDAEVVVDPSEVMLDAYSQEFLDTSRDRTAINNVEILKRYSQQPSHGKSRRIIFKFLVSPTEIHGTEHVEGLKIVHNVLARRSDGSISPRATDKTEVLPVGLVFRSVGYRGVGLAGVPFDDVSATIPNAHGRVLNAPGGKQVTGDYAVGWIKRGPNGIIGTNKPDAVETVEKLLEDMRQNKLNNPSDPSRTGVDAVLNSRNVRVVTFADWQKLDRLELQRGADCDRPRLKFTDIETMLNALDH
jgi:ferredoxin/flavodoxin---NADP+ reductase